MSESRLTDAKKAVLKTHGVTCFDDIVDFDESQSLVKFSDGDTRRICDCYSRVMGYHRPTHAYNAGKQQEHKDRKMFRENRVQFLEGAGHD